METQKLNSVCREAFGKGEARKIRATGRIPAIIYGQEEETLAITVSEQDLRKVLTTGWETTIVDLNIDGKVKKECNVIIKDIQQHPATGKVLHLDFQIIHKGQKIRLEIPVSLTGDPPGVKEMGGILEHGSRELTIRCMPRHIPAMIEIDVSQLRIHDAVHVKDIVDEYPDLEFLGDPEATLAIVVPPKVEVEPTVTDEEAEETVEEPEVIAKGKEEKDAEAGKEKEKEADK